MQFLVHIFAENVWPLVWAIALLELILLIALVGSGRGRLLLWIGLLAALAILLLFVEWLWVTDRERIEGTVDQMSRAVLQEDVDGLVRHLSPQCRYGGLDRRGLEQLATALFREIELDRVTLSQRKTQVLPLRKQGTVEFLAVARGKRAGVDFGPYPTRWILTFDQNSDGQWEVVEIQQIQALGEGRQLLSPPTQPDLLGR